STGRLPHPVRRGRPADPGRRRRAAVGVRRGHLHRVRRRLGVPGDPTAEAGLMVATVRYLLRDVGEAVAFYEDQLGFTVVHRYGTAMAIVGRDGLRLWLA